MACMCACACACAVGCVCVCVRYVSGRADEAQGRRWVTFGVGDAVLLEAQVLNPSVLEGPLDGRVDRGDGGGLHRRRTERHAERGEARLGVLQILLLQLDGLEVARDRLAIHIQPSRRSSMGEATAVYVRVRVRVRWCVCAVRMCVLGRTRSWERVDRPEGEGLATDLGEGEPHALTLPLLVALHHLQARRPEA